MAYGVSNGHVIDNVTWSQKVKFADLEDVTSAESLAAQDILA